MGNIKKIIFFSSAEEVKKCLAECGANSVSGNGILSVGLTPRAYSELLKNGIIAENTSGYFTNESHSGLLKKSKDIISWLDAAVDLSDAETGVRYACKNYFLFRVRLVMHYFLWAIEVVSNVIGAHSPENVCTATSERKRVDTPRIQAEENYLSIIVRSIAGARSLKYGPLIGDGSGGSDTKEHKRRLSDKMRYVIKAICFKLWKNVMKARNISGGDGGPVFFTERSYNMGNLAEETEKNIPDKRIYFLFSPVIASFKLPRILIKIFYGNLSEKVLRWRKTFYGLAATIRDNRPLFSYRGIYFADMLVEKTENDIIDQAVGFMLWALDLSKFLREVRPGTVIVNGSRVDDYLISELCEKEGIKSVLVSHGSHVVAESEDAKAEWDEHGRFFAHAPFSFIAAQSRLAEGYFNTLKSRSEIIRTGPLIWGKPVARRKNPDYENLKVVVHAGTPKYSNGFRLYVYETPDEYIRAINDLAGVIEGMDNTALVVKFRPKIDISVSDMERLVPFSKKVILSCKESFSEILSLADLLVSFSSTVIEEALQNRIPVLLYGGDGRYRHIPAVEIDGEGCIKQSAVYHARDVQKLRYAVKGILTESDNIRKNEKLFVPYIYGEDEKVPFMGLVK